MRALEALRMVLSSPFAAVGGGDGSGGLKAADKERCFSDSPVWQFHSSLWTGRGVARERLLFFLFCFVLPVCGFAAGV